MPTERSTGPVTAHIPPTKTDRPRSEAAASADQPRAAALFPEPSAWETKVLCVMLDASHTTDNQAYIQASLVLSAASCWSPSRPTKTSVVVHCMSSLASHSADGQASCSHATVSSRQSCKLSPILQGFGVDVSYLLRFLKNMKKCSHKFKFFL